MGNRVEYKLSSKLNFKKTKASGLLITFCGLDGCGKTTQINLLQEYLTDKGVSTMLTKQPTEFIRKSDIFRSFMDKPEPVGYDYAALTLFAAGDRVQHSNQVILPALQKGYTVISDRYFFSCLANYRVSGYREERWIYEIAEYIPKPDIAFFLDTEVSAAVSRVRSRKNEKDRYINIDFQQALREEYLKIAYENGGIVIPALFSIQEVFETIKKYIDGRRVI